MMGTYTALLSAFTGTVLARYQPYSQFVPSILGSVVALGFLLYTYQQRRAAAGMQAGG